MNMELCEALENAIDEYNEYVTEDSRLYWWDVLNGITDMTDDDEVIRIIIGIEKQTEKLQMKTAAGY